MTKLTDTQLIILSSAAQRRDHGVLLPERLKGQAARNTVERLISRGLIEEVRATGELPVWRHDDQGRYGLRITSAGLCAIGVEPEAESKSERSPDSDHPAPKDEPAPEHKARKGRASDRHRSAALRSGSKQALIIGLLSREQGATLSNITAATGWLPHTARAALTGLRHKGYALTSSKEMGGARTYWITAPPGPAKAGA
jgi:Protein of unknown function (DUF3489)